MKHPRVIRKLVVVLGDQLNHQALALDGFDDSVDLIWIAKFTLKIFTSHLTRPEVSYF